MNLNFLVDYGIENEIFQSALEIRTKVFVEEQEVDLELEQDSYDNTSFHVLGLNENNEPVCCARILKQDDGWHWGRIAVKKEFRNLKLGNQLLKFLEEYSKDVLDLSKIVLNAQVYAIKFYEKNGFTVEGEQFLEDGIDHIKMTKTIK
ncbi:GNAT family N-acetyltransferase [Spiroplasma culicicola]|uniref:Acetyltransferase, GNAT family protein n=1 Tax=Spiroplasma culicicola AES-1 TaxID=1276246 RepID=W6A6D4_9MOLU|nr:GNAT family N-acetyltransferase [Spiroplasma culicicola]AHI52557.1 acetyltransferase, GNAT family protein [Spiroplasma culicicola AES-1]